MKVPAGDYWVLLVCVVLALANFGLYWPVANYEFVKYDDDTYITDNRIVQRGLSFEGVEWAFTTGRASNWHPVTWLSHMLDCQVFGLESGGHHLVNVVFHTANALLLFFILYRMTTALWASAFVAALFALHPLHVESVAWVSERKDVLSAFFWLLAMWAYVGYVRRPKVVKYGLVVLFFAFSLMSKPMMVTGPFVLLLLDFWPLERVRFGRSVGSEGGSGQKSAVYLLIEKVPLFVCSVVSSVVTFLVQRAGGAVPTMESLGMRSRLGNAAISYAAYVGKMFWPGKLAVLYPHPAGGLSMMKVAVCGVALLLVTAVFVWVGLRRRYVLFGWLWYVGTLVPVIGVVQVGVQSMADRYTYVPYIGLFIIIAWSVREVILRRPGLKFVTAVSAAAVLSAMSVCTAMQIKYWRNSSTLFERTIDVTKENWLMHNNYANILKESGEYEKAVEHFRVALEVKPNNAEVHNNLAGALGKLGRTDKEIEHYRKALELKPDFAVAHYNLATVFLLQGRMDEAIAEYKRSVKFQPDYVEALSQLGFVLSERGDLEEAAGYYKKALAIEPANVIAHGRLGLALASLGRIDEAIREFRVVLSARPDDAEMHFNVGVLLERQGKTDEAIEAYKRSLAINPNQPQVRVRLEAALGKQSDG